MTAIYHLYKTGTAFLSLLYPFLKLHAGVTGRHEKSLKQRFGYYPSDIVTEKNKRPRIWMHAASVGEVSVAKAIWDELAALLPDCEILISTTTETGQAFAKSIFSENISIIYAPVDIPKVVNKALSLFKPDAMVFIETELWPNWTVCTQQMGIPVILVNGRISLRSMKGYERIKRLTKDILDKFDCLSMIHAADAERIARMGADACKIKIHGNAKFDNLTRRNKAEEVESIRNLYGVEDKDLVFVAGSTRQNENEIILKAYQSILEKYPEVLLFIAPRHIERSDEIIRMVRDAGLDCQLRSEFDGNTRQRKAPVVVINTIGELSMVYGLSAFSFCGGSLVPLGGQNILEAVSWGTPVFYGPHMQDFQEARALIESGVGEAFLVKDGNELTQKALFMLKRPEYAKDIGKKALASAMQNTGAAEKHAKEILNLLKLK